VKRRTGAPGEPWQARNVGEATYTGGELRLGGRHGALTWQTAYCYEEIPGVATAGRYVEVGIEVACF